MLCGHLPLVISIAAGILEQQFSGIVDESFIELLSTDDKQVLREGEHGDELVSIEDRLITASLSTYTGKDKEQVEGLFLKFACFPEDVPVPVGVFDALAPLWAGRETKRAHLAGDEGRAEQRAVLRRMESNVERLLRADRGAALAAFGVHRVTCQRRRRRRRMHDGRMRRAL